MTLLIQTPFTDKYPGPFCYRRGVDGVDETFDLECLGSRSHIISTYFWDRVEPCRIVTATVAAALNDLTRWFQYEPLMSDSLLPRFMQAFSGPFATRSGECPGRGAFIEVFCTASGESVIVSYGTDEAEHIADHIAYSLNVFLLGTDKSL